MANAELRKMLAQGETFFAPAVWNPPTARLARHFGFKALYVPAIETGIALGEGEGMATLTQTVALAERALESVRDELPMIADAMSGFGNLNHVQLTVRNFEDAGVSAIYLNDLVYPSVNLGGSMNREAVSIDQYQQRIECAVKARKSRDFLIISHNDVNPASKNPRDEAVKRAKAALEVGADAIFIGNMGTQGDDMQFYRRQIKDVPMMTAPCCGEKWHRNNDGKLLSIEDYKGLGYQVVLYGRVIQPALLAIHDVYKSVKDTGHLPDALPGEDEKIHSIMWTLVGMEEKWAVEASTTEIGQKPH